MRPNRISATTKNQFEKNRVYTVFLDEKVEEILADLHLADAFLGLRQALMPVF